MAGRVSNDTRDQLMTLFRERICEVLQVAPFLHQREVWAASDGLQLSGEVAAKDDQSGLSVRLETGDIVRVAATARKEGRARFLADLGAFKIGKSYGAALWAAGFAAVPGALVSLVGLEYDICAPEFSYICEFLLSDRGMKLKYDSLADRPRDGKMWLDLPNGARFECRSWERKDTLKGKENDAYVYCEAYQLPGIECFTGFSQNLRARRGYAYFATTPDRPWIKDLHRLGWNHHGPDADPEWHCTCSVGAEANPYTFDAKAKVRDQKLMTREKYAIHYEGKLGEFVGHVFNYSLGTHTFSRATHPFLFDAREGDRRSDREQLRVPPGWTIVGGADTGSFYSGLLVAFDPDGTAYVLDEFPNYRYIAGAPERDEQLSVPQWAGRISATTRDLGGRAVYWADANSQFKHELANYGVTLLPDKLPVEARTEAAREYFEHKRILLAPWLSVLPFEIENAAWPEEATASGKFSRVKDRDHTLDCLEHILARRPIGRVISPNPAGTWASSMGYRPIRREGNTHMGKQ